MKKNIFRRINPRKRNLLLGSLFILIITAVGTTFAFQQLNQASLNPDAVSSWPGGRIHDVFELRGTGANRDAEGERNKNVFAENFGDSPIGVRVQFQEFLELYGLAIMNIDGDTPIRMDLNNPATWGIARFDANLNRLNESTAGMIGAQGISWDLGQADGEVKIYMPTFNRVNQPLSDSNITIDPLIPADSIFNHEFVYQFSDTSGRAVDTIAGGFELEDPNLINIDLIEYYGVQTGYAGHTGRQDFWQPNQQHQAFRYYINQHNQLTRSWETHVAQATLTPELGGVMSITAWNVAGRPAGNFWIFDDLAENPTDAWFYWNGLIPPAEATSLLLNATHLPRHQALVYIIRINADFFTLSDLPNDICPARPDNTPCPEDIFVPEETYEFVIEAEQLISEVRRGATNVTIAQDVTLYRLEESVLGPAIADANFVATILEPNSTSSATIGSQLLLTVEMNEPNNVLTIVITETTTGATQTFIVDIIEAYQIEYRVIIEPNTALSVPRDTTSITQIAVVQSRYGANEWVNVIDQPTSFAWSLTDAKNGVSINPETGAITATSTAEFGTTYARACLMINETLRCSNDANSTGDRPITITEYRIRFIDSDPITLMRPALGEAPITHPLGNVIVERADGNGTFQPVTTGNISWATVNANCSSAGRSGTTVPPTGPSREAWITLTDGALIHANGSGIRARWTLPASSGGTVIEDCRAVWVVAPQEYRLVSVMADNDLYLVRGQGHDGNVRPATFRVERRDAGSDQTWQPVTTGNITCSITGTAGGLTVINPTGTGRDCTGNVTPTATLGTARSIQASFTVPAGAANAGEVVTATRRVHVVAPEFQLVTGQSSAINVTRGSTNSPNHTITGDNDSTRRNVTAQRRIPNATGDWSTWSSIMPANLPNSPTWPIRNADGTENTTAGLSATNHATHPWRVTVSASYTATLGLGRYLSASWVIPENWGITGNEAARTIHTAIDNNRPINVTETTATRNVVFNPQGGTWPAPGSGTGNITRTMLRSATTYATVMNTNNIALLNAAQNPPTRTNHLFLGWFDVAQPNVVGVGTHTACAGNRVNHNTTVTPASTAINLFACWGTTREYRLQWNSTAVINAQRGGDAIGSGAVADGHTIARNIRVQERTRNDNGTWGAWVHIPEARHSQFSAPRWDIVPPHAEITASPRDLTNPWRYMISVGQNAPLGTGHALRACWTPTSTDTGQTEVCSTNRNVTITTITGSTITFNPQGGTWPAPGSGTGNIQRTIAEGVYNYATVMNANNTALLNAAQNPPTRTNHLFLGWFDVAQPNVVGVGTHTACAGNRVNANTSRPHGNHTLFACWATTTEYRVRMTTNVSFIDGVDVQRTVPFNTIAATMGTTGTPNHSTGSARLYRRTRSTVGSTTWTSWVGIGTDERNSLSMPNWSIVTATGTPGSNQIGVVNHATTAWRATITPTATAPLGTGNYLRICWTTPVNAIGQTDVCTANFGTNSGREWNDIPITIQEVPEVTITLNAGTGANWGTTAPTGWQRSAPATGNITQISRAVNQGVAWSTITFPEPTTAPANQQFSAWSPVRPTGNVTANFTSTAQWVTENRNITMTLAHGSWANPLPASLTGNGWVRTSATVITRETPNGTPWADVTWPGGTTGDRVIPAAYVTGVGTNRRATSPARPTGNVGTTNLAHTTTTQARIHLASGTGAHWGTTAPTGWTRHLPATGNITEIIQWVNVGATTPTFPAPTTAPANQEFNAWSPVRITPVANAQSSTATWHGVMRTITLNTGACNNWPATVAGWTRVSATQVTTQVRHGALWSTVPAFPTPGAPTNHHFTAWTPVRPANTATVTANWSSTAQCSELPWEYRINTASTPTIHRGQQMAVTVQPQRRRQGASSWENVSTGNITWTWATGGTNITIQSGTGLNRTRNITPSVSNGLTGSSTINLSWASPTGGTIIATQPITVARTWEYRINHTATGTISIAQGTTANSTALVERRQATANGTGWGGWTTVADSGNVTWSIFGTAGGLTAGPRPAPNVGQRLGSATASATATLGSGRSLRATWTAPANTITTLMSGSNHVYFHDVELDIFADRLLNVTLPSVGNLPYPLPAGQNQCQHIGAPSNIWTDSTGFHWCVVATEGAYSMLVSRYIIQHDRIPGFSTNRYHDVNSFVQWPAQVNGTGGPESRTAMRAWWHSASQVSVVLRNAAVNANIPRDTNTSTHSCSQSTDTCTVNTRTANTFLSTPVSTASIIDNPVFFLSEADIVIRMGQDTNARRQTQIIAAGSNNFGSSGTLGTFWLRSAGNNATFPVSVTRTVGWGANNPSSPGTGYAFRPAVWVRR